jgi:peptidoglycan-associated lipoprotein
MKKLILSVLLLNLLAACSSNPPKEESMEPATTSAASTEAPAADAQAATATDAQATADAQAAADAEAAMMEKNSVYFPFDVDAVQDADRETIMNHAEYLASHPDAKVRVEGNADERGSSEYNLGLGQRRAKNTKRALVLGGASDSQIETVSYGEEKPRCSEHNEACWAQNRRADINYSAQ